MDFCVAILILKMGENRQHFQHIMLHYFKKGKNATETQKKICAVYGEGEKWQMRAESNIEQVNREQEWNMGSREFFLPPPFQFFRRELLKYIVVLCN